MKQAIRKAASILLALVMVFGTATVAMADDSGYEAVDSYALNYNGGTGFKWQYFSPYYVTYDTALAGEKEGSPIAFTLTNTGNGAYFPVYCTDLFSPLNAAYSADFRRLNLEDSGFYSPDAAGRLRSIVMNGYPWVEIEALAAASGVEDLTVGEAVAATQAAIWSVAHGDLVQISDFCSYMDTEWSASATEHYAECYAEIEGGYAVSDNETTIEAHIQAAYNYLMGLDATAPRAVTVSTASFGEWSHNVTLESDGTYTVTVTADVTVVMAAGDSLTLSVVLSDGSFTSVALDNGTQRKTLTVTGVSAAGAEGEVTLAIDGMQTVADVYLFDAEGLTGKTQSLIGYADTQLAVHAQVTSVERILNIHKYSPVAGDDYTTKTPLANVMFAIYYVGSLEDYVNGQLGLNEVPTESEISSYAVQHNLVAIVTTDENGLASYNFGAEDAVYMIVELQTSALIAAAADPFYAAVPGVNGDGSYDYVVDAYPKNDVLTEDVDIEKDVTEIGNDSSTYDIGQTHTWIIQSGIPYGIADGKKYEITDTLDERLTYAGNVVVTVAPDDAPAGAETADFTLTQGDHYTLTEAVSDEEIYSFTLSLTTAGMERVAKLVGDSYADYEIRVYFDAVIDEDAGLGEEIPNQAHVDYTNQVGMDYDADSDIPEVHTGGLNLLKVDAADETKALAGATFAIARAAQEGEEPDATITVDGGEISVVYVSFYATDDFTAEKVSEVTTGADGTAHFYGLAYGAYYLIETAAPEGYNRLTWPVVVEVNAVSHEADSQVTVKNQTGIILPSTGGMGTTVFYLLGGAMILAAGALLVSKKRKPTE